MGSIIGWTLILFRSVVISFNIDVIFPADFTENFRAPWKSNSKFSKSTVKISQRFALLLIIVHWWEQVSGRETVQRRSSPHTQVEEIIIWILKKLFSFAKWQIIIQDWNLKCFPSYLILSWIIYNLYKFRNETQIRPAFLSLRDFFSTGERFLAKWKWFHARINA